MELADKLFGDSIPNLENEVEIRPLYSNSKSPKYLVVTKNKKYLEVSNSIKKIIDLIDGKRNIFEIIAKLNNLNDTNFSKSDVINVFKNSLLPYRIVTIDGENNYYVANKPSGKSYLRLRKMIFKYERMFFIVEFLKYLFKPAIFYSILAIILSFHIFFYSNNPEFSIESLNLINMVLLYIILFSSMFFHELGHSSAAHFFGSKSEGIGIGLYLLFPVLYSDVSDVWKLNRHERTVVDLGGIYFNLIFSLGLYLLYTCLRYDIFIIAIYMIDYKVITTLNPFFRFDGYWIFSDITGITNLRQRSKMVLRHFLEKYFLISKADNCDIDIYMTIKQKIFLFLYVIFSNLFFVYFTYKIVLVGIALLRLLLSKL